MLLTRQINTKYNLEDANDINFDSFDKIIDYDKVVYIFCSDCNLTELPKLPNSLLEFRSCYNKLTKLPELPNSLQELYCYNNQLTSLPELPNSLSILYCYNNKFIKKQKQKYLIKIIYI